MKNHEVAFCQTTSKSASRNGNSGITRLALILIMVIGSVATVGQGTGGMWSGNSAALREVGFGS